ncbi:peptidyl-prolyl cis-trans isomerase FKBP13, chloroplastic [Physcomitrium patens]|uniref:peptidylprolyl isomerase n=1 Tax=Physcomitrium patens TaxID=3218 RepID=A0A2K1L6P4_PHYPA|nr:peptidyl-prolyl cis-trans isomerase FKBP13, chloroplastic-like [Physcomitrium patens]PNR61705.1 hypothetical protein PHYPA_000128 [Physcomitrium patens]|eukprot:XP_024386100.1 peptidyl-prolyl cis-trans isomerase FKBP13, chloroplastic-like [Physcomitrella patens]
MASLHCTVSSSSLLSQPCGIQSAVRKLSSSSSSPASSVSVGPRRNGIVCSRAAEPSAEKSSASCSRREVLGLGGILAMEFHGLQAMAIPPEANAAQATCGEFNVTASGLAYCDSEIGSGITASKGMLIKAHYSGRLENGSTFDSSYKRGKPLTFRVGVGEVIRGWDQGILGADGIPAMQAGGKRTLKIPANLGYGERGAGCRLGSCLIPPNSTLIFDVEFVGKA